MNSELELLEKIELYNRGKLGVEEKSAFETQIHSDPQLQKRVEASLIVEEMIICYEASKLKEQMRKDMSSNKVRWKTYFAAALVLLSAGSFLYLLQSVKKNESFEPQPAYPSNKVRVIPQKIERASEEIDEKKSSFPSQESGSNILKRKSEQAIISGNRTVPQTIVDERLPLVPISIDNITGFQDRGSQSEKTIGSTIAKTTEAYSPCENLIGDVDFRTVPSCINGETGELHIDPKSTKGGTPPYVFEIGNKSSSANFYHLGPGTYRLTITDANGCKLEGSQTVSIESKNCKLNKEYTFNPDFDASWLIPYDIARQPKTFKIVDKGGKLFYQAPVEGFQPAEWKGESNTGLSLGLGLYFFSIEYLDGTIEEGSIVLTR